MFLAALKYKKSSHDDNKGKSAFQTTVIELYKQPKKKLKKEHLRLAISCIRVAVISSLLEQLTSPLNIFQTFSTTILTFNG